MKLTFRFAIEHNISKNNDSFVTRIFNCFIFFSSFQYDLRTLLFQLCPCVSRYSKGRHKGMKKRTQGNGYQLYKYTCANTSDFSPANGQWLDRSRTQVKKASKASSKPETTRKMSSASCWSYRVFDITFDWEIIIKLRFIFFLKIFWLLKITTFVFSQYNSDWTTVASSPAKGF